MAETMRAVAWLGGHDVAVIDAPRPKAPPGWTLVDVAYTGVCGTDLHICAGEHPRARPGLVLGHEVVGTLTEDVDGLAAGSPVAVEPLISCGRCEACRNGIPHVCETLRLIGIDVPGGLAEQVAVPTDRLIRLPDDADLRRLAFVEPLAVGVHAVRRGGVGLGDRVGVAGAGPIGLAVAACAREAGASEVRVREPSPDRRAVAERLGFAVEEPDADGHVDVVFDTAAHPTVAATATGWAAVGGTIVVVGTYGRPAPVDLQAIVFRELRLVGTRVYTRRDFEAAARLIADGAVDPEPLITDVVPLEAGPEAIERLRAGRGIKVLVEGAPS